MNNSVNNFLDFLIEQFKNVKVFFSTIAVIVLFACFALIAIKSASNAFYMVLPLFSGDLFDLSWDTYFYYLITLGIQALTLLFSVFICYIMYAILHTIFAYYSYISATKDYLCSEIRLKDSIIKGISWKLHRAKFILFPLLIALISFISLYVVGFLSFNILTAIAGYSIGLVSFLSFLGIGCSIVALIFAFFITGWNYLISSLGFEIAITEPFLTNQTIKKRSERLIFTKKWNYLMYGFNSIYIILIIVQLYKAITTINFVSTENFHIIFAVMVFDLLLFFILKYINVSIYIGSLLSHYDNITINKHYYYEMMKTAHQT